MLTVSPNHPAFAFEALRERCRQLRLPCWRFDNAGLMVQEHDGQGPSGLFMRSGQVTRLISAAVGRMSSASAPEIAEPEPGFYVIGIPERHRRERTGWTVVAALSPEFLETECFRQVCAGVLLDQIPTRIALRPLAVYDRVSVEHLAALVGWSVGDLGQLSENAFVTQGFTRQLTDSFETIDLLYALGRFMGDPTQPREFVRKALDRLTASMQFGWVACWMGASPRARRMEARDAILSGPRAIEPARVQRACELLASRLTPESRSAIHNGAGDLPLPDGTQYLVQPIVRAGGVLGLLVAGDKRGDDPQVSRPRAHSSAPSWKTRSCTPSRTQCSWGR